MKISRNAVAIGAVAVLLAGLSGLPAIGQQTPESILPPGFGEPAPVPAPTATSATPAPGVAPAPALPLALADSATPTPTPTATGTPMPPDLAAYELPAFARRSLAAVGASGDLDGAAFGSERGVFTETLMRRLRAPLPSRWLSIALRRALVSRVDTPAGVNGADFAAERAWLLLRMGEATAARAVVQSVDVADYTPKLFQVAMQAMLANGDPAGLCPLVEPALIVSAESGWVFAQAMCAALAGKPTEASRLYDAARRRTGRTIDALLTEKVVGAGAGGRRAVTIEWVGVDRLTAWRLGLATATGVPIPEELLGVTGPQVAMWRATAPMLTPAVRVGLADAAVAHGVLSSGAFVDLLGEIEAIDNGATDSAVLARDLRSAFAEGSTGDRVKTMRRLWDGGRGTDGRYARLVMTAAAAARVAPSTDRADDAPRLIAAMLAAGNDRTAYRWRSVVPAASDGWAMLTLANPDGASATLDQVDAYVSAAGDAGRPKARMLLACLAGLGRLPVSDAQRLGQSYDVKFGAVNAWTRAIEQAADRREAGSVLLLFAIGMQTSDWRGVPPEVAYHGMVALRAVGLEGEARMIAAEAIARL